MVEWLKASGLPQLGPVFSANQIVGADLLDLEASDLASMGMTDAADYEAVLRASAALGNTAALPSLPMAAALAARAAKAQTSRHSRTSLPPAPAPAPAPAAAAAPAPAPAMTPMPPMAKQASRMGALRFDETPVARPQVSLLHQQARALVFASPAPPPPQALAAAAAPASPAAAQGGALSEDVFEAFVAHASDIETAVAALDVATVLAMTATSLIENERANPSADENGRLAVLVRENSKLRYQLLHLQRALTTLLESQ